jgi:hypothetical protein
VAGARVRDRLHDPFAGFVGLEAQVNEGRWIGKLDVLTHARAVREAKRHGLLSGAFA